MKLLRYSRFCSLLSLAIWDVYEFKHSELHKISDCRETVNFPGPWDSPLSTSCSPLFGKRHTPNSKVRNRAIFIRHSDDFNDRLDSSLLSRRRVHNLRTNTRLEKEPGAANKDKEQQGRNVKAAHHSHYFTSRNCCVFLAASSLFALLLRSSWYSLQFMLAWITLHVKQFGWLHTGQWKVLTLSSYTHHPWQFGVLQWKLLGAWLSAVARLRFKNLLKSSGKRSYITNNRKEKRFTRKYV